MHEDRLSVAWLSSYAIALAVHSVFLSASMAASPPAIFINNHCWSRSEQCQSGSPPSITSIPIPTIHPVEIPLKHGGLNKNPLYLLSDWDNDWVAQQQQLVGARLAALGQHLTGAIQIKDGESAAYFFIRDSASKYPYMRFLVMIQLEMLSPATGALIIDEANRNRNVKLVTTLVGNQNRYILRTLAAQLVDTLYTLTMANDQVIFNIEALEKAVRLGIQANQSVIALNGGETAPIGDTSEHAPHNWAAWMNVCRERHFLLGQYTNNTEVREGLYKATFLEDHAMIYETQSLRTYPLLDPMLAYGKEMYGLSLAVQYYTHRDVLALDIQADIVFITPERWLGAEDAAYMLFSRSDYFSQITFRSYYRTWGYMPFPDAYDRVFTTHSFGDGQLRFLLGRGLNSLLGSPLMRSNLPDSASAPHHALPPGIPLQTLSDMTRDLTPGTATHISLIVGLFSFGGTANVTLMFEWPQHVEDDEVAQLQEHYDGMEEASRNQPCMEENVRFETNEIQHRREPCEKTGDSNCLHLYVTGNASFVIDVTRVIMAKERTDAVFPGWPRNPLSPSVLPQAVYLINEAPSRGFTPPRVCKNERKIQFAESLYSAPSQHVKHSCDFLKMNRPLPHTHSEWFTVEYTDHNARYVHDPEAKGGLSLLPGSNSAVSESWPYQRLVEDAAFIFRRCALFEPNSKFVTCKHYLWFWFPLPVKRKVSLQLSRREAKLQATMLRRLRGFPRVRGVKLKLLPSCVPPTMETPLSAHCELPQAPYEAGPLVGFYTSDTPRNAPLPEEYLRYPPFAAPQMVTWAFRPLNGNGTFNKPPSVASLVNRVKSSVHSLKVITRSHEFESKRRKSRRKTQTPAKRRRRREEN